MPGASRRWFYLAWAGRVWMGGQCGAISVWRRRRTDPIDPLSKVLDGNEASLEGAKSRDIANYPKVPFPQSQNVLNLKFRATHVTLPVIPGDRAPTDRQCLNSSRGERTSFTMSHGNDKKCSCGCSSLYSVLVTVPADGEDGTVHEVR